jgi:DNA replication and repair protein RecF
MILEELSLKNFRSYFDITLKFSARLIFFIGENGEGKTNILEAVSLFSNLKSFRDNSEDELVKWEADFFYIKSVLKINNLDKTLEIGFSKKDSKRKKVKINGQEVEKKSDFIGELKTVVFSPVDLRIVEGGPSERRRFIDSMLCVSDRAYLNDLLEYNRIIKQRNILLKNKNTPVSEIEPWDNLLIERGIRISEKRKLFIEEINVTFKENLNSLSGNKDEMEICYYPNIINVNDYKQTLRNKLEVDFRIGHTTAGIHRDEIFIGMGNKDIISFASQGQKRSVVISLKTSQFRYLHKTTGEMPILLIDDVIRELDVKRREFFVKLILECGQVFFTTTDLEGIKDYIGSLEEKIEIFEVKSGRIEKI